MRKYYNKFNEDYERGYEAGQRASMRNLDESDSNLEQIINTLGKIAKSTFSEKIDILKDGLKFSSIGHPCYLLVTFEDYVCVVHFQVVRGSTCGVSKFEQIQEFVQEAIKFYKKCEFECRKAGYDTIIQL